MISPIFEIALHDVGFQLRFSARLLAWAYIHRRFMTNHKKIPRNLPRKLVAAFQRRLRDWVNTRRDAEGVFTEIYQKNIWGGAPGAICSGGGSHDVQVAEAYISMMHAQAKENHFSSLVFVDLGCGDMAIGRKLIPLCREFVGVDVVAYVINHHQQELGSDRVRFVHADMTKDELPDGDVCLIRQVFQHLSNDQIAAVLPKLRKFQHVYITEHIPSSNDWVPNHDKLHGANIRLVYGSGIDVTAAPFGINSKEVKVVLDVACDANGHQGDAGIIRTILYSPGMCIQA